jgi:hypothetical protein
LAVFNFAFRADADILCAMDAGPASDITKAQLQQSIDTYRVQLSLLVQICTVFVVADATIVGYGIQQRFGAALWVGLIFPASMLMVIRVIVRLTVPVLATAVSIEMKYADSEIGGLMSTFVGVAVSQSFVDQLRACLMLNSEAERNQALSKLARPYLFNGGRPVRFALMLIMIGQTIAPFLLWHFAGWSLLKR